VSKLLEVKDKVQRYLTGNFNGVMIDKDGDFSFRVQSARVFVRVLDWVEDQVAVRVFAPVIMEAPLTQELKDYIALEAGNLVFGAISLQAKDQMATIIYSHAILGDYMDEAELINSCKVVGSMSENLDDDLKKRFGGRRFHED
jgi:hypothetical protein